MLDFLAICLPPNAKNAKQRTLSSSSAKKISLLLFNKIVNYTENTKPSWQADDFKNFFKRGKRFNARGRRKGWFFRFQASGVEHDTPFGPEPSRPQLGALGAA
ncbi:MAG: hypothetical protein NWR15_05125 [Limnohabitans sp.]|nr:hypothetical protein [Limnohabitans sp.]MDP4922876.1 hypothetical protein [Limnohabitans sp.]